MCTQLRFLTFKRFHFISSTPQFSPLMAVTSDALPNENELELGPQK